MPVPAVAAGVAVTGHALRFSAAWLARKQMHRVTGAFVTRLAVPGVSKRATTLVARDMARMFPSSAATTLEAAGIIAQSTGGAAMITHYFYRNPKAIETIQKIAGVAPEALARLSR